MARLSGLPGVAEFGEEGPVGTLQAVEVIVQILAPPMPMLLSLTAAGKLRPSRYAKFTREAELDIITWTFESGGDQTQTSDWLYTGLHDYITKESKTLEVFHTLAAGVDIRSIFSDWAGTVIYYANCVGR